MSCGGASGVWLEDGAEVWASAEAQRKADAVRKLARRMGKGTSESEFLYAHKNEGQEVWSGYTSAHLLFILFW